MKVFNFDTVELVNGKKGVVLSHKGDNYHIGLQHCEGEIDVSKSDIIKVISTKKESEQRQSDIFQKNCRAIIGLN